MKQSPLYRLNFRDILRSLLMAALTPVMFEVQQELQTGKINLNLKSLATVAVSGMVAYLVKQFFTPATPTKEVTATPDGTVTKTAITTDSVKVEVPNNSEVK